MGKEKPQRTAHRCRRRLVGYLVTVLLFAVMVDLSAADDACIAGYATAVVQHEFNLADAYHQSPHLGNEFLLNNAVTRVDLSFDELDRKLSLDLTECPRVHGGDSVLVRSEPRIGLATNQWGVELTTSKTHVDGLLCPVTYADCQVNERSNWIVGQSIMAWRESNSKTPA